MNFFGQLGELVPRRKQADPSAKDESPFAYLAERNEADQSGPSGPELAKTRYEHEFQSRVAAAAEIGQWLQPLLQDLLVAAYPQDELHDFIHWINRDSDCPWIILSDSLEYGSRHQDVRSELIYWDRHPQPHIRWTIGSYSDHPYARAQSWGYDCKIEVALQFADGEPQSFVVRRPSAASSPQHAKVSHIDLTKVLVRMHP